MMVNIFKTEITIEIHLSKLAQLLVKYTLLKLAKSLSLIFVDVQFR